MRAKDLQVMDEQAEAKVEMMNAKIMEAAAHQHVAVAAACRIPKGKGKTGKKPPQQQKWVKKVEKIEEVVFKPKIESVNVVQVDLKIEPITGLDATKVAVQLIVRLNFEPKVRQFKF